MIAPIRHHAIHEFSQSTLDYMLSASAPPSLQRFLRDWMGRLDSTTSCQVSCRTSQGVGDARSIESVPPKLESIHMALADLTTTTYTWENTRTANPPGSPHIRSRTGTKLILGTAMLSTWLIAITAPEIDMGPDDEPRRVSVDAPRQMSLLGLLLLIVGKIGVRREISLDFW